MLKSVSLTIFTTILVFMASNTARAAQGRNPDEDPIHQNGIIKALTNHRPLEIIIEQVQERGVSFELTQPIEDQIQQAGRSLVKEELNRLLHVIKENFRPPNTKPYTIKYRVLSGHAIDLFLAGKISKQTDATLGGVNYILPNSVYKNLSYLVKSFSNVVTAPEFNVHLEGEWHKDAFTDAEMSREYKQGRNKRLFVGGLGDPCKTCFDDELYVYNLSKLVETLNDPNKHWTLINASTGLLIRGSAREPSRRTQQPIDFFYFRRFAARSDLNLFEVTPLQRFYLHITKESMPPDFGIIDLVIEREGDGECGHHGPPARILVKQAAGTRATEAVNQSIDLPIINARPRAHAYFQGPLLSAHVAVIENVSKEPLSVGNFLIRENRTIRLRSRADDVAELDSLPPQPQDIFSRGVLKPGEKLVIPIELSVKIDEVSLSTGDVTDYSMGQEDSDQPDQTVKYSEMLSRIKANKGYRIADPGRRLPIVSAEGIERIMNRRPVNFASPPEYLYGPSVKIESVDINQHTYVVKRFDPKRLLITDGGLESWGSCPYIYTYSPADDSWVNEGVVLYGRNSRLKEATDKKVLNRFDGRLLIKEVDPEDSFIDSIRVKAITSSGAETTIYPRDQRLLSNDGRYLSLKQGEQAIIHFDMPADLPAQKFILVVRGYYVPYKKTSIGKYIKLKTKR